MDGAESAPETGGCSFHGVRVTLDYERLLAAFPRERASLLPCLIASQEAAGYVSSEAMFAISSHTHVPRSEVYGVAKSYNELRFTVPTKPRRIEVCTGLSCLLSGGTSLLAALRAAAPDDCEVEPRPCRFRCDEAPVAIADGRCIPGASVSSVLSAIHAPQHVGAPERRTREPRPGELRRLLSASSTAVDADGALAKGSYQGLEAARGMEPERVVAMVDEARVLGRGGAYFPAAVKWNSARQHAAPRYLVVNAEEGEPGVFKDRLLIERDAHLLIEGMLIAAHAIEAEVIYIYINGEAQHAARRLAKALEEVRGRGIIDGAPAIHVRRGAGGYVCGEESVILASIEGDRAVPRLRPPLPVESGLWGRPTVINNVETLCNLPFVLREGPEKYRAAGTGDHPGTKLLCVSGSVRGPGVYEIPFGVTLRHVIEDIAGGLIEDRRPLAALCGGPSGGLLPPSEWDVPLVPGRLGEGGASLGAGGIVVIDDSMSVRDVVRHLTAYNAEESCGKCTPCREGTVRMVELLDERPPDAVHQLDMLAETITAASLCGLGQMAPLPYLSARCHFNDALERELT
jgi:NADH:ubiquinone oxidoreductase subunit F (NADH-binding)/NADH:ubiquinone oxidoreductase subunit E